jgi:hypothetical protein
MSLCVYPVFQRLRVAKDRRRRRRGFSANRAGARAALVLPHGAAHPATTKEALIVPDLIIQESSVSRREFTLQSALALLSTCIITIEGCGGNASPSPSPTPTPTPTGTDINGSISGNHGHTAVITGAMLTAGSAVSLDIRGNADHPHTVEVSQADLATLKNRQAVSKQSTNNSGHTHTVTFTPA